MKYNNCIHLTVKSVTIFATAKTEPLFTSSDAGVIPKDIMKTYPFTPKSTAYMKEGQIISVPLSNGMFSCGRVLQFLIKGEKKNKVQFIVGLMDWSGRKPPNSEAIAGAKILDHGQAHIKTVKECNAQIVDFRSLDMDGLEVPISLDQSPGKNCNLRQGFITLELATKEQQQNIKVFSTWGYRMLKIKAEQQFVKGITRPSN